MDHSAVVVLSLLSSSSSISSLCSAVQYVMGWVVSESETGFGHRHFTVVYIKRYFDSCLEPRYYPPFDSH